VVQGEGPEFKPQYCKKKLYNSIILEYAELCNHPI
jgi:hypothetical protein